MPQIRSLLALLLAVPAAAQTRPTQKTPTTELPITHVSLYKNGVGFFEHSGRVTGDQSVTIDFTSAQLNDVLQSLTAIDLQGGRISGAGYNSTTPLEQQLKTLPSISPATLPTSTSTTPSAAPASPSPAPVSPSPAACSPSISAPK